jgi:hypothetical protein
VRQINKLLAVCAALGACAITFGQINLNAPTILQGSGFVNRVETYVTVGTDVGTFYVKGKFSVPLQTFTGIGVKDGAAVVGGSLVGKYDFAANSSAFAGLGLPVALDKITAQDFSDRYIGFCAGLQIQFTLTSTSSSTAPAPVKATIIDSLDPREIGQKVSFLRPVRIPSGPGPWPHPWAAHPGSIHSGAIHSGGALGAQA